MRRIAHPLAVAMLFAFTVCPSVLGHTEHAPLPPKVMQAKSVYIENHTGSATFADRAYDELKKWGRFRIVNDAKDADLVLLLTAREYVTGSYTNGHLSDSGYYAESTTTTKHGKTCLTVLDPVTGTALWEDTRSWGTIFQGFRSATRSLVKELRKRIEEQEPDTKGKGK